MTRAMTPAVQALDDELRRAGAIDWADAKRARGPGTELVEHIVGRANLLTDVIGEVLTRRGGIGACESYPAMDKLVLWQSPDRSLRLRLHVFHPGYADRPHNHRWSFLSQVLSGGYVHSLYGAEEQVLTEVAGDGVAPVRFGHRVGAGAGYFLDHSLVHSLSATETTVSLLLRGPAVKDRYFTLDPAVATGVAWSLGNSGETRAEASAKAMTEAGFARVAGVLREARWL